MINKMEVELSKSSSAVKLSQLKCGSCFMCLSEKEVYIIADYDYEDDDDDGDGETDKLLCVCLSADTAGDVLYLKPERVVIPMHFKLVEITE